MWLLLSLPYMQFLLPIYAPQSTTQMTQWHTTYRKCNTPLLLLEKAETKNTSAHSLFDLLLYEDLLET